MKEIKSQKKTPSAKVLHVGRAAIFRAIRNRYPFASRQGKHTPYGGYDVAGALYCFCHKTKQDVAPGWMRYPTAGDLANCLERLGWRRLSAKAVALQLCNLCDNTNPDRAWQFLAELLHQTPLVQIEVSEKSGRRNVQ